MRLHPSLLLLSLALTACEGGKTPQDGGLTQGPDGATDGDGDGYGENDCDDADAATNPGAVEICDGTDNNCDGTVDEGLTSGWYLDADGDGHGNPEDREDACDGVSGRVPTADDCDDTNEAIHPGVDEICDGLDNNCDGSADEGVTLTRYLDTDGDGFGDPESPISTCEAGPGEVDNGEDCDDADGLSHPEATETCDERDNDCDGDTDEGVTQIWYQDIDDDGFGQVSLTTEACAEPAGYSDEPGDCDDGNPSIFPGASETCNFSDDDCDSEIDENTAVDALTWYLDNDGDTYGDARFTTRACTQPGGYAAVATDCDDTASAIHPAASEVCNGWDDDCDTWIDDLDPDRDARTGTAWYADDDADTYGDTADLVWSCLAPAGRIARPGDCDDLVAATNPAAAERCNGRDDNCDGSVDENSAIDAATWYGDADGDGYGSAGAASRACSQPSGAVANATDCDDATFAVNPGVSETCNGRDDDCDGTSDEASAVDAPEWFLDADGDGYGHPTASTRACTAPSGRVANALDCNDGATSVNPGASERCNGVDDDCDSVTDENSAVDALTFYTDADNDGYGNPAAAVRACSLPTGARANNTDCNDTNATISPAGVETCDGVDQDCDGTIDNDEDVLGSTAACAALDCDDLHATRPTLTNGTYYIDPTLSGTGYQARCEMSLADGGWTLIATQSWSGSSWTSSSVRSATLFGSLSTTADYKGPAWNNLPFTDILFENTLKYAAYEGVNTGITAYYAWQAAIPNNCGHGTAYTWAMSEGNLSWTGSCSTNLYMHAKDWDGTIGCPSTSPDDGDGPTWSSSYNNGCRLDDPSLSGFWRHGNTNGGVWATNFPWSASQPLRIWVR